MNSDGKKKSNGESEGKSRGSGKRCSELVEENSKEVVLKVCNSRRSSNRHSATPSSSKRDRETPPCEEDDEYMSVDSVSDDSHENSKKIRTDDINKEKEKPTVDQSLILDEASTSISNQMSSGKSKRKRKSIGRSNGLTNAENNENSKVDEIQNMETSVQKPDAANDSATGKKSSKSTATQPGTSRGKSGSNKSSSKGNSPSSRTECSSSRETSNARATRRRSRSYRSRRPDSSSDDDSSSARRATFSFASRTRSQSASSRRRERSTSAGAGAGSRRPFNILCHSSRNSDTNAAEQAPSAEPQSVNRAEDSSDTSSTSSSGVENASRASRSRTRSRSGSSGFRDLMLPAIGGIFFSGFSPSRRHSNGSRPSTEGSEIQQGAQASAPDDAATAQPAASVGDAVAEVEEAESVGARVRRRRADSRRSRASVVAGVQDESERRARRRRRRHRLMLLANSDDESPSSALDSEDSDLNFSNSDSDAENSRPRRNRRKSDEIEAVVKEDLKKIFDMNTPKSNFCCFKEIQCRQYCGMLGRHVYPRLGEQHYGALFSERYYSSLHVVERLNKYGNLEHHQGCVNAIGFSNDGSILVSGSDDLHICLWDWHKKKLLHALESGHRNNIFQCKFLPLSGDNHVVTCARDGSIRLTVLSDGVAKDRRRIASHNGPCHKLAVSATRPHVILSAGEDGEVKEVDIRENSIRGRKIAVTLNSRGGRVGLYSIHNHPTNENQYCVAGRDPFVYVYDRRITSVVAPPVLKFCPEHLKSTRPRPHVTCAVYSNNGDAIVASYNDEDIYLFDTNVGTDAPFSRRYSGHRNNATVKGVNMFGPRSQFVMSGSDCGNIFVWDRETQAIVNCFKGDEHGVVNVLEWHPQFPLLAASGLDSDIKLFMPKEFCPPDRKLLEKTVERNLRDRQESSNDFDFSDGRMIMMIWEQMRRLRSPRDDSGEEFPRRSSEDNENNPDDDDDDDNNHPRLECSPQ